MCQFSALGARKKSLEATDIYIYIYKLLAAEAAEQFFFILPYKSTHVDVVA